jgi:hypothetical protein
VKNQVWLATGSEVAEWWRKRENIRVTLSTTGQRYELEVSNIGDATIEGATIDVYHPRAAKVVVSATKAWMPEATVRRVDEFRSQVVFGSLTKDTTATSWCSNESFPRRGSAARCRVRRVARARRRRPTRVRGEAPSCCTSRPPRASSSRRKAGPQGAREPVARPHRGARRPYTIVTHPLQLAQTPAATALVLPSAVVLTDEERRAIAQRIDAGEGLLATWMPGHARRGRQGDRADLHRAGVRVSAKPADPGEKFFLDHRGRHAAHL